jgi:hypothetical protein
LLNKEMSDLVEFQLYRCWFRVKPHVNRMLNWTQN